MPYTSTDRSGGFTLLELVIALVLFSFIIVEVLADRQTSLIMSADAKTMQTVRYLAQSKIDEVRYNPDKFGERDEGTFEDLNTEWQTFEHFVWEVEITRVVVIGQGDQLDDEHLFEDQADDLSEPPEDAEGNPVSPRYVRRLTLTVRFLVDHEPKPELSIRIVTYIPPGPEEEES